MPERSSKKNRDKNMERMSAAFKALSNETRLAVFERISLGPCNAMLGKDERQCVCSVADNFNISLSTISHHMKELRNAGLINCERKGQFIFCQPNDETIKMMVEYLNKVIKK
ncbi:MAG: metalloregulator ArsR/SmtB family transcription factor [Deltaproteobacteria bacterium]|nr:metalloregulator ArsR/SmtB family transcription factor [Deltaproteobacteria bacterium]